jgi:hypothetical protein
MENRTCDVTPKRPAAADHAASKTRRAVASHANPARSGGHRDGLILWQEASMALTVSFIRNLDLLRDNEQER